MRKCNNSSNSTSNLDSNVVGECMRQRHLAMRLSSLEPHPCQSVELEQYPTEGNLAAAWLTKSTLATDSQANTYLTWEQVTVFLESVLLFSGQNMSPWSSATHPPLTFFNTMFEKLKVSPSAPSSTVESMDILSNSTNLLIWRS